MSTWFECKIKYEKLMQDGKQKRVTESYLVDAVSFTDAEVRINKALESWVSNDFFVKGIKIMNVSDIILDESKEKFFKCKVSYISIDDERGTQKKTSSYMLIQANSVEDASQILDKAMEDMISDYEILGVQESPIVDVFPFTDETDETDVNKS